MPSQLSVSSQVRIKSRPVFGTTLQLCRPSIASLPDLQLELSFYLQSVEVTKNWHCTLLPCFFGIYLSCAIFMLLTPKKVNYIFGLCKPRHFLSVNVLQKLHNLFAISSEEGFVPFPCTSGTSIYTSIFNWMGTLTVTIQVSIGHKQFTTYMLASRIEDILTK